MTRAAEAAAKPPPGPLGSPASGRPSSSGQSSRDAQLQLQLQRLTRLRNEKKFSESLAPLRQIVGLNPENPSVHHDLGLTYRLCNRLPEAVASFERAIALKPDYATAHHNLGVTLELQGREVAAIAAHRRAVALTPKLADAHSRLGMLLAEQGRVAEAVESLNRASAAASDPAARRLNRAKALLFEENFAEAESWLRRAIAIAPRNGEAHRTLGILLYRSGRFAEAVSSFDQAIAVDPNDVSVYFYLVNAKKIGEADRPLVARMLALIERPGLGQRDRIGLHFGLGKAFDELGDYAQAIRHFDEANRLARVDLVFDQAKFTAENDGLIARFTGDFFAVHAGLGVPGEMPVFILGMPRSGTTLVEQIVSAHPQIGAGGELTFWHEKAPAIVQAQPDGLTPDFLSRIAADYCDLLCRISPNALRVTDKMPANFRLIGAIHLVFPNARFIHCRRHPVDTCLSNYFTQFNRVQTHACSRSDLLFYYREYARLMTHWRAVLPPDRLLEVDYEDLISCRKQVTRRLIGFIGLDWDEACLYPERNDRLIKTASAWQARQPVYRPSVERWRQYEPWLGELRELLPELSGVHQQQPFGP